MYLHVATSRQLANGIHMYMYMDDMWWYLHAVVVHTHLQCTQYKKHTQWHTHPFTCSRCMSLFFHPRRCSSHRPPSPIPHPPSPIPHPPFSVPPYSSPVVGGFLEKFLLTYVVLELTHSLTHTPTVNCWPSENAGKCDVNIEYELQLDYLELTDVFISIPIP